MSTTLDSPDALDAFRRFPPRLAVVRASGLLEPDAGSGLDRLVRLAATAVGVPTFLSVVDGDRDVCVSTNDARLSGEARREVHGRTLCQFTVYGGGPLAISNTDADPAFRGLPTVRSDVVGAYLGVPITVDGQAIGSLAALDYTPHAWRDGDVDLLSELAVSVERSIQLRRTMNDAEVRYRALAELLPVQVWTARPDGQLDFVSSPTPVYFGVSRESLLGDGWSQFVHPDDLPRAVERWTRSLSTGDPYETEFRLKGADGTYRWYLARASAARDTSGKVVSWVGSNTDVERERIARAEAETANRSKSEFLASISHELRTPLNAISGHVQLIEMGVHGPVTDAQLKALARVQRNQQHLLTLVNDLLNFAKLQAGRVEYALENVELAGVVVDLSPMIEAQIEAKKLHYAVDVQPGVTVRADPDKLRQVLLNLLSNAVKFTQAGGHVSVDTTERPDRSPGVIYLRVSDTGAGIPRDKQDSVFDPFVQVSDDKATASAGTGLGLAISLDFARGMGGDLRVRSVEGRGSSFTLTLPTA